MCTIISLFFRIQAGMNAFTEFFKVSPEAAKAFAFFDKKNEEFHHLLAKHAMKALSIVTKVVSEVIYYNLSFSNLSLCFKIVCNIFITLASFIAWNLHTRILILSNKTNFLHKNISCRCLDHKKYS